MKQKIGRNDPCPCGSGKKYKHCCMGKKKEATKSYTQTGQRKFKAKVLSASNQEGSILGGIPAFQSTTTNYQTGSGEKAPSMEKLKKKMAPKTKAKKESDQKFTPTKKDYQKPD